ncbi:MAG TPA: hypothetical protein VNR00_13085 [Opitutus sp.]|nr:hypothetical protein [Opitutus sp.]
MKSIQLQLTEASSPTDDVGAALSLLQGALWARNHMVNNATDGRMKKGTANGRWEISDKGRAWLKGR